MKRKRTKSSPVFLKVSNTEYFSEVLREDDNDSDYSSSDSFCWIDNFLTKIDSQWLCRVPDDFIFDNFNLYGLSKAIPDYDRCLSVIRDILRISDGEMSEVKTHTLEATTQSLYFLIHARYVQSESGMKRILEKYKNGVYGVCPRTECNGQHVVPTGWSSQLGVSECCVYCPRCKDVFHSYDEKISLIDGAAFGLSFGPLFFNTYPELVPDEEPVTLPKSVFGFKLNESRSRNVHPYK